MHHPLILLNFHSIFLHLHSIFPNRIPLIKLLFLIAFEIMMMLGSLEGVVAAAAV